MGVHIESIGKEDDQYIDHVLNVSLSHSFAEAALRMQLSTGATTIVICDAHDSHETSNQSGMSDTQPLVKKLAESIRELPVFDEPEPVHNDWYYSGKKVAQWKRETQFIRQKKK